MKKLIVIVLSVFALSTLEVIGQCNSETFSNQCIPKLATGFNFLKSYKIEKGGKDYVEYSYVFTKGTQYMINICAASQPTDGIVVSLFDSRPEQSSLQQSKRTVYFGYCLSLQYNRHLLYSI